MMPTTTPTKLSLWEFARLLEINPLHFFGIDLASLEGANWCDLPWIQYSWQDANRIGRETVAEAIATAEAMMEEYLNFKLLPTYEVAEAITPRGRGRPEFVGRAYPLNLQGLSAAAFTKWGWLLQGGTRALTLLPIIQQGEGPDLADIVWSNGGYWQIGTVLADCTGITDPEEIRVFYPTKGADPSWEIRPATVAIAGDVATITFKRECAVEPDLWDALVFEAANGDDDNDFLSTVDVYRVYTNPADQLGLQWAPVPFCGSCPPNGTCVACGTTTQSGCSTVVAPKLGAFSWRPATWNAETEEFDNAALCLGWGPQQLQYSYLAGFRDRASSTPLKEMATPWKQAVAYLACSLLNRPPCDCSADQWERWTEDLSTSNPGSANMAGAITRVAPEDLSGPFGTRRGAIWAWRQVMAGQANPNAVLAR